MSHSKFQKVSRPAKAGSVRQKIRTRKQDLKKEMSKDGRHPSSQKDWRPRQHLQQDDEEDDEFALPSTFFSSARRLPAIASDAPPPPNDAMTRRGASQQQQQQQQQQIPRENLAVISTYDKGTRGQAEEDVRVNAINARIRRSRQKEDDGLKRSKINDSLLKDKVGVMAGVYLDTSRYTSDFRTQGLPTKQKEEDGDDEEEEEENDEDADDGVIPMNIDRRPVVYPATSDKGKEEMFPEEDDDENGQFYVASRPPRELLFPTPALSMAETALPDTEQYGKIDTFQEYAAPQKGRPQFDRTMQHIGGKEQAFFVEVAPDEERYKHVSGTLNEKIGRQAFLEHVVRVGREIPILPRVTKAEVRSARAAPLKGECLCVRGNRCESYLYSKELIEKNPEKYKGFQPWACKEFYYGSKTDVVRQGIALGETPDKIKHDPVLCVMCHEEIVSTLYKFNKMGLEDPTVELHILHAYQYIIGPGEYPETAMIMGDNTFKGIAAPFIRYQRDNYVWIPDRTGGPQCWSERESLDFD